MTLLWKRKKAVEKPMETAYSFVKSTMRSAAMLSLHTLLCCNAMCLTRRIIGREHRWKYVKKTPLSEGVHFLVLIKSHMCA